MPILNQQKNFISMTTFNYLHEEKLSELGREFQIFGAEEKKDLSPDKVLSVTRWILRKLLDEECLSDLGTGESSL